MLHIEQMLENKTNLVIEKQQQIPRDILAKKQCKKAIKSRHCGKSNVSTPIPNIKKVRKETLQQQEQEKEDNGKR